MSKSLIIYISRYNSIGGVERFVENFCKRMNKHYDITLLFDWAESNSLLLEMSDFVNIKKLDHKEKYKCDYFINSTAWGYEPYNHIQAKKQIQIIHADFTHVIANWDFQYKKHKNTTHHICVGELVKKAFEVATPYKCDKIIYNLLDNTIKLENKPKNDKLTLITVSRLSGEKGFDRMLQFAKLLELNKIDYIWSVYGNKNNNYNNAIVKKFQNTKVNFKGVIRNPFPEINKADYLVQLSDTEGFAYSVYEALQCKTPCIITPFASGNEQIKDGVNGYVIPFDLQNIDLKQIVNNIPTVKDFQEIGSEQSWIDFLENGKEKTNNTKNTKAN
jgi:glycosyltransferase involved in cell wall biosynthesis